jgi:hypothetical protein
LIYCINIYVTYPKVVEVCSFRGVRSWWGGSLAWMAHSLSIHVRLAGIDQ